MTTRVLPLNYSDGSLGTNGVDFLTSEVGTAPTWASEDAGASYIQLRPGVNNVGGSFQVPTSGIPAAWFSNPTVVVQAMATTDWTDLYLNLHLANGSFTFGHFTNNGGFPTLSGGVYHEAKISFGLGSAVVANLIADAAAGDSYIGITVGGGTGDVSTSGEVRLSYLALLIAEETATVPGDLYIGIINDVSDPYAVLHYDTSSNTLVNSIVAGAVPSGTGAHPLVGGVSGPKHEQILLVEGGFILPYPTAGFGTRIQGGTSLSLLSAKEAWGANAYGRDYAFVSAFDSQTGTYLIADQSGFMQDNSGTQWTLIEFNPDGSEVAGHLRPADNLSGAGSWQGAWDQKNRKWYWPWRPSIYKWDRVSDVQIEWDDGVADGWIWSMGGRTAPDGTVYIYREDSHVSFHANIVEKRAPDYTLLDTFSFASVPDPITMTTPYGSPVYYSYTGAPTTGAFTMAVSADGSTLYIPDTYVGDTANPGDRNINVIHVISTATMTWTGAFYIPSNFSDGWAQLNQNQIVVWVDYPAASIPPPLRLSQRDDVLGTNTGHARLNVASSGVQTASSEQFTRAPRITVRQVYQ